MKLINKSMLTAIITLSTASVYYAQQVQDTVKSTRSKDIDEVVLIGVADIAKDRKTPVAVSTIKEAQIVERLGNQEFPEILNTTPSVYATKGGGGFGDSKLIIRGFSQENIAVMVNGMPVNDMENGRVFWSNWAGLSDVTSSMQVQRGLGSSKLAIASVGGTVNILTRAADKKQGGIVSLSVGNNDYLKTLFAYNTGKSAKGWSSSFLMSRTAGSTFARGTEFEGYNYYFALGYNKPGSNHDFQFTITGAPQAHNQRSTYSSISNYIKYNSDKDGTPDTRYNADYGYLNGEEYSFRRNYYHKPIMSLNWDWNISSRSKLNTVAYASFGRGAGTGNIGNVGNLTNTTTRNLESFRTADGILDVDGIYAANAASNPDRGILIRNASINSHNWFGAISSFNHKVTDHLNFTVGIDTRYYYGYHYQVVSDLLGGSAYRDSANKNLWVPNNNNFLQPGYNYVSNTSKAEANWNPFGGKIDPIENRIGYNNDGEVLWYGGFGQLEYSNDKISAFVSGALSNQAFQRIDNFIVDGKSLLNGNVAGYATTNTATSPVNQPTALNPALNTKTGFKNLIGFNVKGGANYNINENHNVFGNIGYYEKQPFLNSVYPNNKNFLNPNLTNEKIFGIELGYGFRSGIFNANVNLYRTSWSDRFLRRTNLSGTYLDPISGAPVVTTSAYANISGISEVHQGIEIDATANVHKMLSLNGMLSMGDYYYKGNAESDLFSETNDPISFTNGTPSHSTVYLDKVKVGNAAQFTAGAGFTFRPTDWLSLDGTYRGVKHLYANVNPLNFSTEAAGQKGALELPSFGLVDAGITFKIKLKNAKQFFTLRGNVYNLLNKVYIAESNTNTHANLSAQQYADINGGTLASTATAYATYQAAGNWNGISQQNQVYFGFGRTWTATLSFNF
ncbi:TonB-dependent receptor plug domain-containing protein [uncultured Chryseobacterium sp.]|uniref:TonB-dependent receptor n=1 Tax=uncultured Chryseobacterium sp. TaxID=259322 RepID=UPI0025FE78B9|nr:TonB-dependent receptor plug domain-containing protein [uncultured Chryseobacterium sp.]